MKSIDRAWTMAMIPRIRLGELMWFVLIVAAGVNVVAQNLHTKFVYYADVVIVEPSYEPLLSISLFALVIFGPNFWIWAKRSKKSR